jgi:hypothetical protein
MNTSIGFGLGFTQSHVLVHDHSHISRQRAYTRAVLKAFRRVIIGNKTLYTCNVARLRECGRLGSEQEVSLWKTHFFMCSRHFDDVFGVIFNQRPGEELSSFTARRVKHLYLQQGEREILNMKTGKRIRVSEPPAFASLED